MKANEIELTAWLKNNETWYVPSNGNLLNISNFKNFEIIHYYNGNNFLVYCWDADKIDGRLFKAKLK